MPIIAGRASAAYGAGFGKLLSAGGVFAPVSAFDALGTVIVPSGGLASITFAGIPQNYSHLQVRAYHLYSNSGANIFATFNNGDFANVYSHFLVGNGTNPPVSGNDPTGRIISFQSGNTSTAFCSAIYDFLDYNSSSKNKTMRGFVGQDVNGAGGVGLLSALAVSTTPINAITFTYNGGSFIENTRFALYGVK
jgi:hypothetical protein